MDYLIPYYSLEKMHDDMKEELITSFDQVLQSGWFILGDNLKKFEKKFAEFMQVNFAIGVGNGYDAIKIALNSLEFKSGDEIIIPALTFSASIQAALAAQIQPVLVDVDPEYYLINAELASSKITADTKALMPVHLYGNPCDMISLLNLAEIHGLIIVEDFAQAVGAFYRKKPVGSIGNINATSFYPVKPLGGLGDGGMITTNDEALRDKCFHLRNYGYSTKYELEMDGCNSRLDEIQAAFLLRKLKHLKNWNSERQMIARRYIHNLKDVEQIILPAYQPGGAPAHHIFPIQTRKRNDLMQFLKTKGIETQIHYPIPPHLQPALKSLGYKQGDFPVTEKICHSELSLPIYPGLKLNHVDLISEMIYNFLKRNG
jgi:dTDP-4-amino-4,6-dideoxygalactose transaminase